MKEKGAICWDLDETLGKFDQVHYGLRGKETPKRQEGVFVRAGIRELLSHLSNRGYHHYISTSSGEVFAREALRASGLDEFIDPDDIWAGDIIYKGSRGRKMYSGIEEAAFFNDKTREKYADSMLVIGDSPGDQPEDLEKLVFIEDTNYNTHNAKVLRIIIDNLIKMGKGSFKKGFDEIFQSAELEFTYPARKGRETYEIDVKRANAGSGVEFLMEYSGPVYGSAGNTFPKVFNLKSEKFRDNLIRVE